MSAQKEGKFSYTQRGVLITYYREHVNAWEGEVGCSIVFCIRLEGGMFNDILKYTSWQDV
jgi:hypothetical protein